MQRGSSITTGTAVSEVQRSRGASVFFRIVLVGLLVVGAVSGLAWLGVIGNSVSAGATVPVVDNTLGTFADSGQSLGSGYSLDVALGDLDGDGDLDAFVANTSGEANKGWTNDGSGAFTDSGQSLGSALSKNVALGDLDGDGDLDAFVANDGSPATKGNKVWTNDGSGTFTDSGQSLGSTSSQNVALGDLDGDGDIDAFVATANAGNEVWTNDGSGTFTDSGQSLGSASTIGVALGDLDGDGDLDAFFADFNPNNVWANDGSGTFTDSGQSLGSVNSYAVTLGDLDGDGDLDAFVVNTTNEANKVWLGQGHLDIWYLAEGYTGSGFSTFILIMNPNSAAAAVQVTYMLDSGTNVTKTHTVSANSRYTIAAGDAAQAGSDQAFGTKLVSNRSIVVERAMYWGTDGGHVTAGIRG